MSRYNSFKHVWGEKTRLNALKMHIQNICTYFEMYLEVFAKKRKKIEEENLRGKIK